MTYATQSALETRFGAAEILQLTDREGLGIVDVGVLAGALAEADAEINAYLVGHYVLPLATVPAILGRLACDIARYRLASDNPLEEVRKRYEDARRLLEALAAGRVTLDLPTTSQSVGGLVEMVSGRGRVFNGGL